MLKFINIPLFIISLCIGFIFLYLKKDDKRIIMIYPTPDNYDNIQYSDYGGNTFQFSQSVVDCQGSTIDTPHIVQ